MTPRDYQAKDLDRIEERYRAGDRRLLVHYATGLGKGVLCAFVAQRFERLMEQGMMIMVPRREIAWQMQENVRTVLPSASVGIEMGRRRATLEEDVLIVSAHSLGRRNSGRIERMMTSYGIYVNDEAHHTYRGGVADNVLSWFGVGSGKTRRAGSGPPPLVLHMTATPQREDEHSLAPFLDAALPSRDIRFGVERGWLTDIKAYKVVDDPGGVSDMDGYEADLIYRAYADYCLDLSALVFAPNLQVARLATRRMNERGVKAAYIDGETDKEVRDERLRQHREGEVDVIVNFGCLVEGYDDPTLQAEIMARGTESERLYTQMVGRALRPACNVDAAGSAEERRQMIAASEKPHAHIIDIAHNTEQLSLQQTAENVMGVESGRTVGTGLSGDPDLVSEVIDEIDEIDEEQTERDLRAEDPETLRLAVQGVDVWSQTVYSEELRSITPLRWVRHEEEDGKVYSLYMPRLPGADRPADRTPHILRIEPNPSAQNGADAYRVLLIDEGGYVHQRGRPKRSTAEKITTIAEGEIRGTMQQLERRIATADRELLQRLRRDFFEPNEPASAAQIRRLKDAGFAFDEDAMTALTADLLLKHHKVERKVRRIVAGEEGTTDARALLSNT